jgi:O-antigen/teichoic acid export membrane protein
MARVAEETVERGRSRIAENTVALAIAGALQMIFTLVQLGVLSRYLGSERFGLYVALRGFSLLLTTVILVGLPQVLIRYLPSFQRRGRRSSAAAWFFLFSGVVMTLGSVLFFTAPRWAGLMPDNLFVPGETLRWMILASIALGLKLVLYGGLSGLREMRTQMICELAFQVVFTAIVLFWRERLDVTLLFTALFAFNALTWVAGIPAYLVLLRRSFTTDKGSAVGGIVLPSPAGYWGSALALSYAALAFSDVDRFVMASLIPVAAISIYHVASRINQLIKRFLGFPVIALQPELTRIYEEGRWDELSGRIGLFTKASVTAALAIAAVAAATGGVMITLISGPDYPGAYRLLLVLLPTVPLAAFIAPLTAAMKGLHYMKWAVVCDLSWMVVYFAGLFVIVPYAGLIGTAVAQLAASAVQGTAAVLLARKEGLYPRARGTAMFRALAASLLFAGAGAAACAAWRLPAAAACILLAPFLLRLEVRRLSLFDPEESSTLVEMLRGRPGSGLIRWVLSMER